MLSRVPSHCDLSPERAAGGSAFLHCGEHTGGGAGAHLCITSAVSLHFSLHSNPFLGDKKLKGEQLLPQRVPEIASKSRPELQPVSGVSSETKSSSAVFQLLLVSGKSSSITLNSPSKKFEDLPVLKSSNWVFAAKNRVFFVLAQHLSLVLMTRASQDAFNTA